MSRWTLDEIRCFEETAMREEGLARTSSGEEAATAAEVARALRGILAMIRDSLGGSATPEGRQKIRDLSASLIQEYERRQPRMHMDAYVEMEIERALGPLDAIGKGIVKAMITAYLRPRAWDGETWR